MEQAKLLQPAKKQTAYAKVGIYGSAGSGKTFTACLIARGLAKMRKSEKPVSFLDTETGSDYEIDRFKKAGLSLLIARTRAFKDLLATTKEAQTVSDVFVVDSLTHFWMELCKAWATKLKRAYGKLWLSDYQIVKAEWRPFTDLYLLSHLDVIVCGRAGSIYEYTKDDETGKMTYVEVGTRMKAEREMGYEPSLLIEMELIQDVKKNKWVHRAWVVKDRTDTISGEFFDDPTFEDFLPALSFIDISGTAKQEVLDVSASSVDMLADADWSGVEYEKQRTILVEQIEALFKCYFDTRSTKGKKEMFEVMEEIFDTMSATQIKNMKLDDLQQGYDLLKAKLEPEPLGEEKTPDRAKEDAPVEETGWKGWLDNQDHNTQEMIKNCQPLMKLRIIKRVELMNEAEGEPKKVCELAEELATK